jgi:excisionase family DNA binding protein
MEIRRALLLSSVSRSVIYAAIKSGELPSKKIRRWRRVAVQDFERWLGAPVLPRNVA